MDNHSHYKNQFPEEGKLYAQAWGGCVWRGACGGVFLFIGTNHHYIDHGRKYPIKRKKKASPQVILSLLCLPHFVILRSLSTLHRCKLMTTVKLLKTYQSKLYPKIKRFKTVKQFQNQLKETLV